MDNTNKEDWTSFFIDYDIFTFINGWEKQKIYLLIAVRLLFAAITFKEKKIIPKT
jgi:hypothetical protein